MEISLGVQAELQEIVASLLSAGLGTLLYTASTYAPVNMYAAQRGCTIVLCVDSGHRFKMTTYL